MRSLRREYIFVQKTPVAENARWTGIYDITKIWPHVTSIFHFGFENMTFALNIGKMPNPKTRVYARPKPGFSDLENGRVTQVRGNLGLWETWVYKPNRQTQPIIS